MSYLTISLRITMRSIKIHPDLQKLELSFTLVYISKKHTCTPIKVIIVISHIYFYEVLTSDPRVIEFMSYLTISLRITMRSIKIHPDLQKLELSFTLVYISKKHTCTPIKVIIVISHIYFYEVLTSVRCAPAYTKKAVQQCSSFAQCVHHS